MTKTPKFNRRSQAEAWLSGQGFKEVSPFVWETTVRRAFVQQVLGGRMPSVQVLVEQKQAAAQARAWSSRRPIHS